MKTIPIVKSDCIALVDDEDYEYLVQFEWYLKESERTFYAVRFLPTRKRRTESMHRAITGFKETDHRNGNGLDNRRGNLRAATSSQNQANRTKSRGNYSSKYKGVYWCKRTDKWAAQIHVSYKNKSLGYFTNEIEAAEAYDRAACHYFGEFALTNFQKYWWESTNSDE